MPFSFLPILAIASLAPALADGQTEKDCFVSSTQSVPSRSLLQRKSWSDLKDMEVLSKDNFEKEVDHAAQAQAVLKPTPSMSDRFESCVSSGSGSPNTFALATDHTDFNQASQSSSSGTTCNDKTEVALFVAKDSTPYYEVQCCPAQEQFCAGCAKMNSGKTSCDLCSGGYTKTNDGNCVACADLPGWENKAGQNCYKAPCSDELFQGFSANQACCKCRGGQATATKFAYYVGPMALGSATVLGHPVPRTASHYSVDKDCELSKFGLSIDAGTGALKLAAGCNVLGCGASASIEVKCTITASQSNGLSSSSPLIVNVGHIGYGSAVVLQQGSSSVAPATDGTGSFKASCVPEAIEWLSVDGAGVLSLKSGAGTGGSLTDQSSTNLGRGGVCNIEHGTRQTQVMVLAPKAWTSISYSYGTSTLLYATVGQRSPLIPVRGGDGVAPSRYSASCAGGAFAFDELTGVATWEGHEIFSVDVKTGGLQMQPEESLTKTFDAIDVNAVRRKINLQCTIFGHYEWLPAGQGPILTHSLRLEVRDQTCWAKKRMNFAHRHYKGSKSESDCRSLCRSDATCSHFHLQSNQCYFFSGVCKRADDFACKYKDEWVYEHYPGCGERGSCINIKLPNFHYVSGKYCPRGENVEVTGQGPVYFKQGLTTQETFWLQRYDTSRGDSECADGDWAVLKPAPRKDFENMTMGYVELHGDIVACLKSSSSDLPSDVFINSEMPLSVKKISTNGAAHAVVSAPGCQKPNITGKDKAEAEEAEEMSVFPLVFDDPSTDAADDHWLHPCECVPPSWGALPPAAGDSLGEIPPGSYNEFIVPPFQIVEGEFVCEQENLLEIQVLSEDEAMDSGACRTKCLAQQCPYYWEGEVMSSKQCRIYSACNELVRELGTVGSIYGVSYRKSCRIADPQKCWHVTKRRSFLGAGSDAYGCLFQDLLQQCDHKLMLGGMGVGVCGTCTYAPVPGRRIYASNGECMDYDPGNQNVKVHGCHLEDNQKWFFDGELLKTEHSDCCLDYDPGDGRVYMNPSCHAQSNQLWYFDGSLLKSRYDNKCLDFQTLSKDIYVGNCPGSNTQHWNWKQTVHGGQRLHTDHNHGRCLRVDSDGNLLMATCDVSMASRFYFSGEELKSEADAGQCVDYHPETSNMYLHSCHGGSNQKFYFDGQYLKNRNDDRCVDWTPHTNNVYMGNCPGSPSRRWSMHDIELPLPNTMISNMQDGKCWDMAMDDSKNVYLHSCSGTSNQKFYFDGEQIKLEHNGECLDEGDNQNLYMYPCHNGDNQRFYWDGHRLHNRKWGSAKCVDYGGDNGNLYMYECHHGANQLFNLRTPQRIKSRRDPGWCFDMDPESKRAYMYPCHDGNNQLFWFDGAFLKVETDHNLCLDYHPSTSDIYFHECHGGDNQKFIWFGEELKVASDQSKCMNWQTSDNNVFAAECTGSNEQLFYFDAAIYKGKRLQSEASSSECLDAHNGNAYTVGCHDGSWQRFYFDGEHIKVEGDTNKCLDYAQQAGSTENGNLQLYDCHSGASNQKWYWDGNLLKSRSDNRCLDVNPGNKNVFVGSCPDSNTQHWTHRSDLHNSRPLTVGGGKCLADTGSTGSNVEATGCGEDARVMWYFDGEQLKTEADNNCLDVNTETGNLYMYGCHSGKNQKFYFDGNLLKTRQGLDRTSKVTTIDVVDASKTTGQWEYVGDYLSNPGPQGFCQSTEDNCGVIEFDLTCSTETSVKFQAEIISPSTGDDSLYIQMKGDTSRKTWHTGVNAEWGWSSESPEVVAPSGESTVQFWGREDGISVRSFQIIIGHVGCKFKKENPTSQEDDLCLDYHVSSGNVYAGTCPHHQMTQYKMQGGAMLQKLPLPEDFLHGQNLDISCWSERFHSLQAETLSCVAGRWINSQGKMGLDGFSCAACVQVVTPKYAAFDAQMRQELFFAGGLKLHLTVDTRTPRSVTASGNLRAGGTKDIFVAELLPDAEEILRRYRSITVEGQCLTATSGKRLTATACAREAEPLQMLEAMDLSSLMWEEFKAEAIVPSPSSSYLANRGSGPTTLRSFTLNGDCGDHAMSAVGFYHGTRLGMTSTCTAASTYGNHAEHWIDVPGHVQITSVSSGDCLSIHHIVPWQLKDRWSGKCMDYHPEVMNTYASDCHDGNNQKWYMIDGNIISLLDGKCLDYHPGTTNVYMHECHDGSNQRWYFDEDSAQIRSEYDHQCLDVNQQSAKYNIYIHPCHDGNNQKFDRSENTGSAFNKPLHLQCSGSPEEEIKVEPIGDQNKFYLVSHPHFMPGQWQYDFWTQRLTNVRTNKCLKAHHRNTGTEETCMESVEQEWIIGHGLQGLADAPISCEGNQVISFLEKGFAHIRYKCVHVAALGSCVPGYSPQVDTKALELEDVKALKKMVAACPAGHGLRKLEAEASDKGAWIRLRYECCQINRVPVSVYPYVDGGGHREFMSNLANGWEGVYCPSTQDDSGRMQFTQRRSFRPHHSPSGSLQYDKFQGKWCVSGKACASSDVVHPLDVGLSTHEWHVVPLSDFDAVFEARGVKPLGGKPKRPPPPLIKFGASDPEYLPECKDESHPGARKFKLELMNKEAEDLDDENPCKYVFGKPPKNQKMDESEGMTGWIDDLSGTTEPGQGGVTYKSVKECSDRDIVRELKLAKWNEEHFDATKYNWIPEDILGGIGSSVEFETAPMGFGLAFNPFAMIEAAGNMIVHGVEMGFDQQLSGRDMHFEQAGHDDCNPIQHGFARTFCDLHCIRDAVRKGDDAILRALEEAVEIVGKNTQLLLEHYVGEGSTPGLLEKGKKIEHGIAQSLGEMLAMGREAALEPRASVAATRAIRLFTHRWSGANVSNVVPQLVSDLRDLHGTVAKLSSRKLSESKEVQRYALQTASQMDQFMEAQSHVLGIYHHEARISKLLQRQLNRVWKTSVTSSALLLEMEEEVAEEDVKQFDAMWWDVRKELDGYLQASQEYVAATQTASQMLQDYSAKCTSGFSDLKRAYTFSARAEKKAHKTLKSTWAAVTTGVGEMASKVVDGAILNHLAVHDLRSLSSKSVLSKMNASQKSTFCLGNATAAFGLVRSAAMETMKRGLFGQTHRQLLILFEELKMLQSRFISGGLGSPPDIDMLEEAQTRLQSALSQSTLASGKVAKAMVKRLRAFCDP